MKRTIVCLCGSTRFMDEFIAANKRETMAGKIVLSVGCFGHVDADIDMESQVKVDLDHLHFDKIAMSDEILVLNVGGYIGESTRKEIDYAIRMNKSVRYLE